MLSTRVPKSTFTNTHNHFLRLKHSKPQRQLLQVAEECGQREAAALQDYGQVNCAFIDIKITNFLNGFARLHNFLIKA